MFKRLYIGMIFRFPQARRALCIGTKEAKLVHVPFSFLVLWDRPLGVLQTREVGSVSCNWWWWSLALLHACKSSHLPCHA